MKNDEKLKNLLTAKKIQVSGRGNWENFVILNFKLEFLNFGRL